MRSFHQSCAEAVGRRHRDPTLLAVDGRGLRGAPWGCGPGRLYRDSGVVCQACRHTRGSRSCDRALGLSCDPVTSAVVAASREKITGRSGAVLSLVGSTRGVPLGLTAWFRHSFVHSHTGPLLPSGSRFGYPIAIDRNGRSGRLRGFAWDSDSGSLAPPRSKVAEPKVFPAQGSPPQDKGMVSYSAVRRDSDDFGVGNVDAAIAEGHEEDQCEYVC